MTMAFSIIAALALFGGLMGGVALARILAPFRGQTGRLSRTDNLRIFGATLLAALPAMAVLLGLIDYDSPPTIALFLVTGGVTALPLLIPTQRLPRSMAPVALGLGLATLSAAATLFWASQQFRESREALHRACSAATESLTAARSCRAHVDTHWSLPADLPQT